MEEQNGESSIIFNVEIPAYELDNQRHIIDWLITISEAHFRKIALIEYILTSDKHILEVNKEYLDHDYYTDIITFPIEESPIEATIFISVDRVRENAQTYDTVFIDELHRVMVHGLLHLIGYDDKNEAAKNKMRDKENHCLSLRSFI